MPKPGYRTTEFYAILAAHLALTSEDDADGLEAAHIALHEDRGGDGTLPTAAGCGASYTGTIATSRVP